MMLITILGGGVFVAVLGFCYGLPAARVARSATPMWSPGISSPPPVRAASAPSPSLLGELLPNVRHRVGRWRHAVVVDAIVVFVAVVLGLGVAPPTPDWGLMVSDARLYLTVIPLAALAPMIALSSLIVGINLTADALGKALGVDRAQKPPS
jgi:peptide/nickel transport system permease protein